MRWILFLGCVCLIGCGGGATQSTAYTGPYPNGARIYKTQCVACHQLDGSGTIRGNRFAADFTDPDGVLARTDEQISNSILNGFEGRYGMMPAFKGRFRDADLKELVGYLRESFSAKTTDTTSNTEEEGSTQPESNAP